MVNESRERRTQSALLLFAVKCCWPETVPLYPGVLTGGPVCGGGVSQCPVVPGPHWLRNCHHPLSQCPQPLSIWPQLNEFNDILHSNPATDTQSASDVYVDKVFFCPFTLPFLPFWANWFRYLEYKGRHCTILSPLMMMILGFIRSFVKLRLYVSVSCGKRPNIYIFCCLWGPRLDDNSDLILRPQSRNFMDNFSPMYHHYQGWVCHSPRPGPGPS